MLHQANWQKKMAREGHLDDYYNMHYGTALADAFIAKYRSSYDTIAKAIIEVRRDPGRRPRASFTELRKICKGAGGKEIMGEDLARLVQLCDWYDPMLKARDGIIHDNLTSSGFMHPRIFFQIYNYDKDNGRVKLIDIPEVMVNENLVDFELYAAVHIGYTFWLLEEFARVAYDILQVRKFPDSETIKSGYIGLDILKDSIERVLADNKGSPICIDR